jgi:hypothetical protein
VARQRWRVGPEGRSRQRHGGAGGETEVAEARNQQAGGRGQAGGTRKTIGDLINSVAYSIYYNDHNFRYFKLFIIFGYYSAS